MHIHPRTDSPADSSADVDAAAAPADVAPADAPDAPSPEAPSPDADVAPADASAPDAPDTPAPGTPGTLTTLPTAVTPQDFETTWGHRLLAGVGFVMFIAGVVIAVYFAMKLSDVSAFADVADWLVTMGTAVYGAGMAAGLVLLPPGVLAVLVAKRPRHAVLAVAASAFALVLVVAFVACAFALEAGSAQTILLVGVLLAVTPVVYLAASLKVLRSTQ